jgi:hypothetical protein
LEEEFEDTKGVIRIRISKKNRQHNGQKKKYTISVNNKSLSIIEYICIGVSVMVFNATFNSISVISWRSVLLVEETGEPGENH